MAGHVQSIHACNHQDTYAIKATCLPEMKKTILDFVYALDRGILHMLNVDVQQALHQVLAVNIIAALCYALEEYCRISSIRSPTACTSQLQKWNQPRKRKLDPAPLATMKFVKEEYGKKKREHTMKQDDPRPSRLQCTTKEEIDAFTQKLKSTRIFACYI